MVLNKKKLHLLVENIGIHFLKDHISDVGRSVEKLKKLIKIDEDCAIINPDEIVDFINFNIYMERDRMNNEKNENKENELISLSQFIEAGKSEEIYENNESEYERGQVVKYISDISKQLPFDFFEKNENIIITFK